MNSPLGALTVTITIIIILLIGSVTYRTTQQPDLARNGGGLLLDEVRSPVLHARSGETIHSTFTRRVRFLMPDGSIQFRNETFEVTLYNHGDTPGMTTE